MSPDTICRACDGRGAIVRRGASGVEWREKCDACDGRGHVEGKQDTAGRADNSRDAGIPRETDEAARSPLSFPDSTFGPLEDPRRRRGHGVPGSKCGDDCGWCGRCS